MSAKFYTIGNSTVSYGGYRLREIGRGSLTISKTVTGSGFDPSKTFELTATFSRPVTYNGVTSTVHTFHLAHGQSVTIPDIPELTEYTVAESPLPPQDIVAGYSFEGMAGGSGVISDGQAQAVATNSYTPTILPARTLRLLYPDGVTPSFHYGTGTQVSSSPNVWDLHYDHNSWAGLLSDHQVMQVISVGDTSGIRNTSAMFARCSDLTTVPLFDTSACTDMGVMFVNCHSLTSIPLFNTSACTEMYSMFFNCYALASAPLFDTSACTRMSQMFYNCTSLTSVPLFDTRLCREMYSMFYGCTNVEGGALALYQQASSRISPPGHTRAFRDCGINTTTGAAELEQIPSDWK